MSIQSEIDRISGNVSASYDAIEEKGGTLPQVQNSNNLANAIMSISSGMTASFIVSGESAGLTINAYKGNKVRPLTWNGSVYRNDNIDEFGEWTVIKEVSEIDPSATLSGTGNTTYCYATINGTKRYGAGTYTVNAGSTIVFGVYGRSSSYEGSVTINGSKVLSVTNQTTQTYSWTVPSGTESMTISFSYNSTSSQRNGKIVVVSKVAQEESAVVEVIQDYVVSFVPPLEIVPWSSTDDAKILAMVNALDSGQITIADTGWKVGDTRTVNLSAMSATGVGESHAAQSVEFVLMDTALQGMTPASSSKPLHFAVGMKDGLKETGYMNSSNTNTGGWDGSARRAWCNNVFANSLPSDFKACFRQFTWQVGKGGGASSGLTTSTDLFALPVEKQIFGSRSYSQSDEASKYSQWTWYATSANRIKKVNGSANYWWESSPRSGDSYSFCGVGSSGNASSDGASDNIALSPFGCI